MHLKPCWQLFQIIIGLLRRLCYIKKTQEKLRYFWVVSELAISSYPQHIPYWLITIKSYLIGQHQEVEKESKLSFLEEVLNVCLSEQPQQ